VCDPPLRIDRQRGVNAAKTDALRRAAEAIRQAQSGDCIVLAKAALQAAIRNEADLLALLPDLPAGLTPRRSIEGDVAEAVHAA
jgi:hypothetical protein